MNDNVLDYEIRLHNLKRQVGLVPIDEEFDFRHNRMTKTGSELDNRNQLFGN